MIRFSKTNIISRLESGTGPALIHCQSSKRRSGTFLSIEFALTGRERTGHIDSKGPFINDVIIFFNPAHFLTYFLIRSKNVCFGNTLAVLCTLEVELVVEKTFSVRTNFSFKVSLHYVSVLGSVRWLRCQNPALICSPEQYHFIYELVKKSLKLSIRFSFGDKGREY